MLNVHDPAAGTLAQLEPLTTNSPGLLLVIADTVTAAEPTLPSVTVCGALVLPSVVSGIDTPAGNESCPVPGGGFDATPVPVRERTSAPPPA
jgi:hypothetical protein